MASHGLGFTLLRAGARCGYGLSTVSLELTKTSGGIHGSERAIYVGGAIGVELLTGWLFIKDNEQFGLGYHLAAAAEEAMEIGGIVLFIHAVTDYAEKTFGAIHVRVGQG